FTGMLAFPNGRRQEVKGSFSPTHYQMKGVPTVEFPTWETVCLLEEAVGPVPKGVELWWNEPE
ncbi:MAG: hypothetical protein J2P36_31880, partial [Ktedonobacteraceae bacterium]|nr:hypothetical protein [Ktedonobacteraceae bacterium]